jgi:hypothetical protein
MGIVDRARDPKLSRAVALKVLPPKLVDNAERKRRGPAATFIVVELIPGVKLRDLLQK